LTTVGWTIRYSVYLEGREYQSPSSHTRRGGHGSLARRCGADELAPPADRTQGSTIRCRERLGGMLRYWTQLYGSKRSERFLVSLERSAFRATPAPAIVFRLTP
jgi:hypothetical protein